MKSFPKISVLLPTYNHSSFIAEAINSILIQEYPNIEIVVGDDCSTDNTREIISNFEQNNPNIFKLIFHSENVGVTANCNKILKNCDGEFIALFSGDDVWLPGKLHAQIKWFSENQEASLCFTSTEVINDSGDLMYNARTPNSELLNENVLKSTYLLGECGASFLIKKECLPVRGFPKEITLFSDWYLWTAVAFAGKIGGLNKVYTKYRKHLGSTSATNNNIMILDHLKCLILLKNDFPLHATQLDLEIQEKTREFLEFSSINALNYFKTKSLTKEIIHRLLKF